MNILKCAVLSSIFIMSVSTGQVMANQSADAESQSVAVASVGGSSVNVNPNISIDQTFEGGKRSYPIPGQLSFPGLPGYFGDNNRPGHQFIPLDKLMMYDTVWTIEESKQMLKSKSGGKKANFVALVPKGGEESQQIICTKTKIDTNKFNVTRLAFGTVNATNENSISADVLAKVLVESSKYGATHIQFLSEGTNTELKAESVGIGFNYNKATDSSISTGGTGWSKGWAGYINLPWMQFIVLKVVENEDYDPSKDIVEQPINLTQQEDIPAATPQPLPVILYQESKW